MTDIDITNIVGTIEYGQRFDLGAVAKGLENRDEVQKINYDPSELHLIHSWWDGVYVAFYQNGTCSTVGHDSVESFEQVVHTINTAMEDMIGFDDTPEVSIKNIVATAELGSIPSLELIAVSLGFEKVEYEPEQFGGLIRTFEDGVVMVFSTGKVVCTGCSSVEQAQQIVDTIESEIQAITESG
ncbi:transcription factor [Haloarcula amylolytica]|uniref:transcription factor n=1 Tax=Haloarcula amylolytica TaxID=396317 RepID=UPI003C7376EB